MKRKLLGLLLILAVHLTAFAKQTLILHSGEEIEVTIISIGSSEIQYKKVSNPDGPTYSTARNNVFLIIHENGTKEIITTLEHTEASANSGNSLSQATVTQPANKQTLTSSVTDYVTKLDAKQKEEREKIYFPKAQVFPRATIGFHATPSGYKDSYDLDWGGLYWAGDFNVLIPSSYNTAWSVGFGATGLGGKMNALYTSNGTPHKDFMGEFSTIYLTTPIQIWTKYSDLIMTGFGPRSEILVSQKMNNQKVEDAFNIFRLSLVATLVFSFGNFDLGIDLTFNSFNALSGKDLDWSPSLIISANAAYRF